MNFRRDLTTFKCPCPAAWNNAVWFLLSTTFTSAPSFKKKIIYIKSMNWRSDKKEADFKYFCKKGIVRLHNWQKADYALIISRLQIIEKWPINWFNRSIGSSLTSTHHSFKGMPSESVSSRNIKYINDNGYSNWMCFFFQLFKSMNSNSGETLTSSYSDRLRWYTFKTMMSTG